MRLHFNVVRLTVNPGGAKGISIGIDDTTSYKLASKASGNSGDISVDVSAIFSELPLVSHYAYPLMRVYSASTHGWIFYETSQWETEASFQGEVVWN